MLDCDITLHVLGPQLTQCRNVSSPSVAARLHSCLVLLARTYRSCFVLLLLSVMCRMKSDEGTDRRRSTDRPCERKFRGLIRGGSTVEALLSGDMSLNLPCNSYQLAAR